VGDWGTGQDAAKTVLAQIARKNPDVVIHMGDVYYSGTDFEMQNYFYNIWKESLDLTKVPTFTLAGIMTCSAGGAPYYKLIDQLGQPASYFCLRNDNWQFLAMDTGLHDNNPEGGGPTYLEDTEVTWIADKIQNRGNRRTVLLSHHQLFAANEAICGQSVNDRLNQQLSPLLPGVDMWLWGHEQTSSFTKSTWAFSRAASAMVRFRSVSRTSCHSDVSRRSDVPLRLAITGSFTTTAT